MSLSILGCQQSFVQRYLSMGSRQQVTKVLMYNIPVVTVLFSLAWVVGMVIYAVYESCDPLSYGYIKNLDEILPFYVGDRFSFFPGLLGLFMATLFNGALSLNVSLVNSLATVAYEDFLKPFSVLKGLKEDYELWTIKGISVVCGLIIMGMSFVVSMIDGVIEASMLVTSVTSGPLLGVFLLAMLIPVANGKVRNHVYLDIL
ncbi:sodium-coupled monocarboxylate transporter 2-like [Diabrotica undecimpunctata]|uniref:sodium-coupled monocarboxylate transporter 2-like n=1 Tax=Diabrotica undecimpunctata TaxID=50387 RepID=UPI003B63AE41